MKLSKNTSEGQENIKGKTWPFFFLCEVLQIIFELTKEELGNLDDKTRKPLISCKLKEDRRLFCIVDCVDLTITQVRDQRKVHYNSKNYIITNGKQGNTITQKWENSLADK